MKLLTRLILTITVLFGHGNIGIAQNKISVDTTSSVDLRVNPRSALMEEIPAEDAIDSIHYIPLEANKTSTFNNIDQLIITSEYYIILDQTHMMQNSSVTSAILIFDHDGKFHSKLLFPMTYFFAVDAKNREIQVIDFTNFMQTVYSFEGKKIRTFNPPFSFEAFVYGDNTIISFRNSNFDKGLDKGLESADLQFNNLIISDLTYKVQHAALEFDTTKIKRKEIRTGNLAFLNASGQELLFHQPYTTDIYEIANTKLNRKFRFLFPLENSLPLNFKSNNEFDGKRLDHLNKFPLEIYDISNVFRSQDVLTFKLFQ